MDDFSYHRPKDVEEAISLYQSADDPMYLSGGMTLIPTMKQRLAEPTDVIDLSGLPELTGVKSLKDRLTIGAFTRHNDVANHEAIQAKLPVFVETSSRHRRQSGA